MHNFLIMNYELTSKAPVKSLTFLNPWRSQYSTMPCATLTVIVGSMKLAVPISIADAPASKNSTASVADEMPPNPITGIFTALATCHTILKAIGLTHAPDKPPVTVDNLGLLFSASIAIPRSVLINDTESAPDASAANAKSAMLVTL